jgi:SMC interacting uncharacterized protein involved in chromosome segregation
MSQIQTQQWMQDNLGKLKTMRDELRVELHLAGMEAKEKLKEIEPLVKKAEQLAGDVSEVSRKSMAEIVHKVEEFAKAIKSARGGGPVARA